MLDKQVRSLAGNCPAEYLNIAIISIGIPIINL